MSQSEFCNTSKWNTVRRVFRKRWYGLQAVGKRAIYGAEPYIMGVNALYPDGLKAIPPFMETTILE